MYWRDSLRNKTDFPRPTFPLKFRAFLRSTRGNVVDGGKALPWHDGLWWRNWWFLEPLSLLAGKVREKSINWIFRDCLICQQVRQQTIPNPINEFTYRASHRISTERVSIKDPSMQICGGFPLANSTFVELPCLCFQPKAPMWTTMGN